MKDKFQRRGEVGVGTALYLNHQEVCLVMHRLGISPAGENSLVTGLVVVHTLKWRRGVILFSYGKKQNVGQEVPGMKVFIGTICLEVRMGLILI